MKFSVLLGDGLGVIRLCVDGGGGMLAASTKNVQNFLISKRSYYTCDNESSLVLNKRKCASCI